MSKDFLKAAAVVMMATTAWIIINPVRILVWAIVTAFPVVMIVGLALAAYLLLSNVDSERAREGRASSRR